MPKTWTADEGNVFFMTTPGLTLPAPPKGFWICLVGRRFDSDEEVKNAGTHYMEQVVPRKSFLRASKNA